MNRYGMMNEWGMGSMHFAGPLMMVIIFAAVIALIVFLIRAFSTHQNFSSNISASELLQERFARGEIDEAEYFRARQVIGA